MPIPSAHQLHPIAGYANMVFLNQLIQHPRIHIGDYTYYDDMLDPQRFLKNVRYFFDFDTQHLHIGKFCAIASDTEFIMPGANHYMDGFTTYPFFVMGGDWANSMEGKSFPEKGDTRIENDVWLGYKSMIMPGIRIGNGAIVAAGSVVTHDVPDYAVVGGNPAKVIKMRFSDAEITQLLNLAWWNWPVERITEALPHLLTQDIKALTNYYHTWKPL